MKPYQKFLELFLQHLESYTSNLKTKSPQELYEPEIYILNLGGKRLRPLLALIAADLFDKQPQIALNSALCVELFHNFSLIHDDILDAAPLRRNQPTVHTKWNTNIGILSGDVMLTKAFQVLESYDGNEYKQLNKLFSKTAIEVCEGQQEDMNFETAKLTTVSNYIDMITKKTAVLLGCSLQMGAINANVDIETQLNLYEFGKHLGIAFQLLDDLLDAYATDKDKFGKQVGGDIIANKKTFLLLKAFELGSPLQKQELEKLAFEKNHSKKIENTLKLFSELNVKNYCQQEADAHTQIAISCLQKIKASEEKKNNLKQFAFELLNRQV
ncbi:MAG: polyprenyl synthetase family protein [Bacteroidota bacterium]|nr:polyprenyl synthetase family protein [Bacteroidota bacterium]